MRFVIFSKTLWSELPRIRHQVARLLAADGHEVLFVEKAKPFYCRSSTWSGEGIDFVRYPELFHHQLRPVRSTVDLNALFCKRQILRNVNIRSDDRILNFNYDYCFLRELFPKNNIVTIINDDFVSLARPWMKKNARDQFARTCKMSNRVLAVSYPLLAQVKKYNPVAELFLPWSPAYKAPKLDCRREVVLYYGFINQRVDWDGIDFLVKNGVRLRIVGPVEGRNVKQRIQSLQQEGSIEYLSGRPLSEVYFDDVCCSIALYDKNVPGIRAITVNNRVFQLLSVGIPVIYSDLPYLLASPDSVIKKNRDTRELVADIKFFQHNFYQCQQDIKNFLTNHSAVMRSHQLLGAN